MVSLGLSVVSTVQPLPTHASSDDGLITQICMASFKAAMASAGKVPPAGMGAYSCRCFLDELTGGASIEKAQTSCKAKAAARYKL